MYTIAAYCGDASIQLHATSSVRPPSGASSLQTNGGPFLESGEARKLFHSVRWPTCGVHAGMRCLLHSGRLRDEPHIGRKLTAIEAVESKRIQDLKGLKNGE